MARTRRQYLAVAAGSIAITGCQSGNVESTVPTDDTGGSTASPATTASQAETTGDDDPGTTPAIEVREHRDFGAILVDPEGMTLYMFDSDSRDGGESSCYTGCQEAWPALTVSGDATAGAGVDAQLTTFQRSDGSTQVAANGWPLYYYASDSSPGDASGQGVNGVWWIVDPAGSPIRSSGPSPTATETSGGGVGY